MISEGLSFPTSPAGLRTEPACVSLAISAQAAVHPDRVAVVDRGLALTYGQLVERALTLAQRVTDLALGDARIGVAVERSADAVVALLAILLARHAFVPLDVDAPPARLAFQLADAQVGALIAEPKARKTLTAYAGPIISVDASGPPAPVGLPELRPRDLAYVLYTSGSTGQPKGVMVERGSLARHCLDIAAYHRYTAADRVLQFASLAFDAALEQVFAPLTAGAAIVLRDAELWTPAAFRAQLLAQAITVVDLPPAYLHQLAEHWVADPDTRPGPGLRRVIVGGDRLSAETLTLWRRAALEHVTLVNAYGPTEATITATVAEVTGDTGSITIGRPLPGRSAHVLDADGRPAPDGEVGELCLGGVGLARGYLGRPDLTAERFVPDPFATDQPGARLYRTGDRVRRLPDGQLEFHGRHDRQVKIRGQRLELDEVEAALKTHPAIQDACVLARPNGSAGPVLTAFVEAREKPGIEQLREHLAQHLPTYMIPVAWSVLDALPRSASGKVDVTRLPEPTPDSARLGGRAPRDAVEASLSEIWMDLLGRTTTDIDEPFFDAGGHSLLAVELVARIERRFGVALPPSIVWAAPTIAALAARLASGSTTERLPRAARCVPSPGQERLWFMDRWLPDSALYNLPLRIRAVGLSDMGVLRRSLRDLTRRHAALRTTFTSEQDRLEARIAADVDPEFAVHDLRGSPEIERAEMLERLWRQEARRPFNLTAGPLVRLAVARLDDVTAELLLTIHHIAFDGWSLGILLKEWTTLITAYAGAPSPALNEPKTTYADYAAWQHTLQHSRGWDDSRAFWQRYLAGAPQLLELPTDRARPARQTFRGARRSRTLDAARLKRLEALAQRAHTTLFTALLAVYQVVIGRVTGQDDFILGVPVANREHPATRDVVGFFVNTLPWRADLTGAPSFTALLERVRRASVDLLARQDLPLEAILDAIGVARGTGRNPLIQALFVFQDAPTSVAAPDGVHLSLIEEVDTGCAKFDLTGSIEFTGATPRLVVEYNTDLYTAHTIDRLMAHVEAAVEAVVADPDRSIADLDLLTADDRQRLDVDWQGATLAFDERATLDGLFDVQARRSPDSIALRVGGAALTYRQLQEQVDAIAGRLLRVGAERGQLIGVCLPRGTDLIPALLAILKVGCAYVPLDPAYPRERLAFMLDDSQSRLVLTTSGLRDRLPAVGSTIVTLDDPDADSAETFHDSRSEASALAYLIYTSGSTGRPKGVMLTHRNAGALIAWAATVYSLDELRGVLASTSICFDLSIFEIFFPLASGGTVVLVENALDLPASPDRENVTLLNTVPSAMTELLAMGGLPASLTTVNLAGEPLKRDLAQRVYALPQVRKVYNLYGPSEDTTYSTVALVPRDAAVEPTIGRPIANTQAYVLDVSLRRVLPGAIGELYLAGDGLSTGYWRRPELSADRFLPNPFGPGRLYRTGDRVRQRPDGELEFLGRRDHQIKLRGFRIELAEIEAALQHHPAVAGVVVSVRDDVVGAPALVAYVALRPGSSEPDLRGFLRERLPAYMAPAFIVPLEALPLTPNGKIDRARLPRPNTSLHPTQVAVAPSGPVARCVADVYAEVLRAPVIGPDDDFFDLGGQSLLATQVATRVERVFRLKLPVRVVFEASTPERLARYLIEHEPAPGHCERAAALHLRLKALSPEAREALLKGGLRQP